MAVDPVSLAITIALTAAQMALTASQHHEGQRLDSTKVQTGDYGAPLPIAFGYVRLPGIPIWADDLREVKQERKTKGGKYSEYTYYGNWAVAITGHEITSIEKMRFDTFLVYDNTGSGPTSPFEFTEEDNPTISDLFALYLGTETQSPDPFMAAIIEAQYGVGWCPAYRGTSYVVLKNIPLDKFGNRIPQTEFELTGIMGTP